MFFPPIQDYLEEHGLSDISTRRFGNFTMQVGQTYGSASQGMSHHDWYTFLAAASWLDGAGRFGPAVNLASSWNATAPKPASVQTTQPSSTIGRTITLNNGRVVNVQTGGGRIVQGNLQSPNVPRMTNVNGRWLRNSTQPRHINRGSTGRTIPRNATEQAVMDMVRRDPLSGATQTPLTLTDPRWSATEGWMKMQVVATQKNGNIVIHFNWNPTLNLVDDFKIVHPTKIPLEPN